MNGMKMAPSQYLTKASRKYRLRDKFVQDENNTIP